MASAGSKEWVAWVAAKVAGKADSVAARVEVASADSKEWVAWVAEARVVVASAEADSEGVDSAAAKVVAAVGTAAATV